jgi:hypothetical protein
MGLFLGKRLDLYCKLCGCSGGLMVQRGKKRFTAKSTKKKDKFTTEKNAEITEKIMRAPEFIRSSRKSE